jgi:hypothetical protein
MKFYETIFPMMYHLIISYNHFYDQTHLFELIYPIPIPPTKKYDNEQHFHDLITIKLRPP